MKYKAYRKEDLYSYIFGAFPVIELIEAKPELIIEVIISNKYNEIENLVTILESKGINYNIDDKTINRIANKGNIFVVGVFKKVDQTIGDDNHIVLHSPSNMGNLGTIIRTMVGFGLHDLAIIGNSCDIYNPMVTRASMGAFFKVRIEFFNNIHEYLEKFKDRKIHPFMLSLKNPLKLVDVNPEGKFSLVFGNEGSGLPDFFEDIGEPIFIPQTDEVDSLNLTMAAGIAMFWFMKEKIG